MFWQTADLARVTVLEHSLAPASEDWQAAVRRFMETATKTAPSGIRSGCRPKRTDSDRKAEDPRDAPGVPMHREGLLRRGSGRSRTDDGGFAIRCLSHLATEPQSNQATRYGSLGQLVKS